MAQYRRKVEHEARCGAALHSSPDQVEFLRQIKFDAVLRALIAPRAKPRALSTPKGNEGRKGEHAPTIAPSGLCRQDYAASSTAISAPQARLAAMVGIIRTSA